MYLRYLKNKYYNYIILRLTCINIKKTNISENCFKVLEGKTEAVQRVIPIHPLLFKEL